MKGVAPLIHEISFGALPADKAFDADWLLQNLDERGATAVIPPKANRKVQRDYDAHMYKWRHLIENYFAFSSFPFRERLPGAGLSIFSTLLSQPS